MVNLPPPQTKTSNSSPRFAWHGVYLLLPTTSRPPFSTSRVCFAIQCSLACAKQSANFTQFYSLSAFTSQTFGGFVAARYPSEIKRSGYFLSKYHDEEVMFPELLQKAGALTEGARIFGYRVDNPSRYGVASLDEYSSKKQENDRSV